jgi:hypothetical protein
MRRSHLLPPALAIALPLAFAWRSRVGGLARAGMGAYGAALLATAISRFGAGIRDACSLPAILATMHLSWGFGFLVGSARFGPPLRAILILARGRSREPSGAA